jgi:hypothetical protein
MVPLLVSVLVVGVLGALARWIWRGVEPSGHSPPPPPPPRTGGRRW